MEQGIDELIEWLLTKIAYSGLEGLSAREFVAAVKAFYCQEGGPGGGPAVSSSQTVAASDVAQASTVWRWVVKRKDVVVVPEHAASKSLEEVLSPLQVSSTTSAPSDGQASSTTPTEDNEPAATLDNEPHLLLSEERQWKAIAGHGPDYKRIPLFEWRALVAIASVGENGILQGDLTRLTGQDKRSLPTRTEALARKGYIIKKQAMLRGCKTSKLYLAQFANEAMGDVQREGLPLEVMNIPAEEITRSWDPVSFTHYYNDDGPIDYVAISQAFMVITKAYKAMRYCDLRTKMQITTRVPQMRALAKSTRHWARAGVIRFEPMQSRKGGKVFKDCIKFIRDPTAEEWKKYKSAPKSHVSIPSSRIRATKKKPTKINEQSTGDKSTKPQVSELQLEQQRQQQEARRVKTPPGPSLIQLSAWDPYKPIASTFIDIIKRSGSEGSSNPELGAFNLGWPYRKYISTLTTLLSLPRTLPPHLEAFAIYSRFTRLGKTMTYTFYAHGAIIGDVARDTVPTELQLGSNSQVGEASTSRDDDHRVDDSCFPKPSPSQFLRPGSKVKSFLSSMSNRTSRNAGIKRKRDHEGDKLASKAKRTKLTSSATIESSPAKARPVIPRKPGVYYGKKNSLDPFKNKGRPRNSIVMTFVTPALRDPEFFSRRQPRQPLSPPGEPIAGSPDEAEKVTVPPRAADDASINEISDQKTPPAKRERTARDKSFRCDNCGSVYKHIHGLTYHATKSRTSCNPNWKPVIEEEFAIPTPSAQRRREVSVEASDVASDVGSDLMSVTPKKKLPSRRPRLAVPETQVPAQENRSPSRGVTIYPVALSNLLEVSDPALKTSTSALENVSKPAAAAQDKALPKPLQEDRWADESIPQTLIGPVDSAPRQKVYGRQKEAAIRKAQATDLILRLLERNNQVLPGDISLYCLVAARWKHEVEDASISVLDWKPFQNLLKSMVRAKTISIEHFGRLYKGVLTPSPIIYKGWYEKPFLKPDNLVRKIEEVKNRYEEIYPKPYIPSSFSLSSAELQICRETMQTYLDTGNVDNSSNHETSGTTELSTLGYAMPSAQNADNGGLDDLHRNTRRTRRREYMVEELALDNAPKRQTRRNTRQATSQGSDENQRWAIEMAPPGLTRALEASSSTYFVAPLIPATFEKMTRDNPAEEDEGEDDDEDDYLDAELEAKTNNSGHSIESSMFTPWRPIAASVSGIWPDLSLAYFMENSEKSFAMAGTFPERRWFLRQNLPQCTNEMVERAQLRQDADQQANSRYGRFGAKLAAIEAWERSPEGAYLQNLGNIAPEYIFISLSVERERANLRSIAAEWQDDLQFSVDRVPAGFDQSEDEEPTLPEEIYVPEGPLKRGLGGRTRRFVKRSEGNWKFRTLFPIKKRETGRWNRERAVGANIGREKETELVVAIVALRKLLGGVDRITDWGLFLMLYPEWSIAGIRKFWIRVTKERANYIDALTKKFETEFIEAYDKGVLPPLNYDDIENYDWRGLISWAVKLDIHNGIELPTTRQQFDSDFFLVDPKRDEEDWRELWFHFQTSTYDRLDAVSSIQMTMPVSKPSQPIDSVPESDLQLARSWVRSLCNKNEASVGAEVRERLLKRGKRDKTSLNELLERAVTQLLDTKVISRLFGKGLGQVFKMNNHFDQRLKKFAHTEKYIQAIAFKASMDEAFRHNKEVRIQTDTNDGSIMALINMQAHGRIYLDEVKPPNIPYGFEPGNYEGRKYSKRYYLFDVKVLPTGRYEYNDDLAIVKHARDMPVPLKGPLDEIPIWCDFFGKLDRPRWAQYLGMLAFAISVKGPLNAKTAAELLQPVIEVFECQLIIDWLDSMGLLERSAGINGAFVGEWWWLVTGTQLDVKGKGVAR